MVSTNLKNISQIGNLPEIVVKIQNVGNHHPEYVWAIYYNKSLTWMFRGLFWSDRIPLLDLGGSTSSSTQKLAKQNFVTQKFFKDNGVVKPL